MPATKEKVDYIKQLSDDRLEAVISYEPNGQLNWDNPELVKLSLELQPDGSYINFNWILGRVGEELYMRDVMPEEDWMTFQELTS